MKIVKKILISEKEKKHLQWLIDWYDCHDEELYENGIDTTKDLYDIVLDLLDCEVSEEAEED